MAMLAKVLVNGAGAGKDSSGELTMDQLRISLPLGKYPLHSYHATKQRTQNTRTEVTGLILGRLREGCIGTLLTSGVGCDGLYPALVAGANFIVPWCLSHS